MLTKDYFAPRLRLADLEKINEAFLVKDRIDAILKGESLPEHSVAQNMSHRLPSNIYFALRTARWKRENNNAD